MLFMDFVWNESTRNDFLANSHRARYLRSSAIINPPRPVTPLFAIQFAAFNNVPLYLTPHESLIILAPSSGYYLLSTSDATRICATTPVRNADLATPTRRLRIPPGLWTDSPSLATTGFDPYWIEAASLHSLYQSICRMTVHGNVAPNWTAADLRSIIRRPTDPEPGVGLGTSVNCTGIERAAEPPSRRLIGRKRRHKELHDEADHE